VGVNARDGCDGARHAGARLHLILGDVGLFWVIRALLGDVGLFWVIRALLGDVGLFWVCT